MLNPKRQRFVDEYLVDLNATQAAIRAGYSAKTANEQGARLLADVSVQAAIQEAIGKRSQRTEITQDMVLQELAKLAFANHLDFIKVQADGSAVIDLSELTRDQAAAIQEFTVDEYVDGRGEDAREVRKVKLKLHDKKGALVDVGKHLGMFKAGEVDPAQVNVTIQIGGEPVDA